MSNKLVKPLSLAVGTGLIGSLSLAQIAQANPVFHLHSLAAGYAQSAAGSEGKCGEAKCGANMGKKCTELSGQATQDQCIAEAHAGHKANIEGKCGEAKCGANMGKKCMELSGKTAQDQCIVEAHAGRKDKEGSGSDR
jgi:uncharacterized low-complexity protein